jgi:hypothetical protein
MKYKITEKWVRADGVMYVIDFVDIINGKTYYPANKRFCSIKSAEKFMNTFALSLEDEPKTTLTKETIRTKENIGKGDRGGFIYEAILEDEE